MYRLIRQTVFRFTEQNNKNYKNVSQYLKAKKNERVALQVQHNNPQQQNNAKDAHRLLYVQYFPSALFVFPLIYYINDPTSIYFNLCSNSMQYYLSGVLSFNAFFTQININKYYLFIFTVGALNCLTGPYSMAAPIILGLLNFYFPFTDEKYHKFENAAHQQKVTTYLKVQAIYYFLISLVLTFKFYHYQSVRQLEARLNQIDSQNKAFYSTPQSKEAL